MVQPAVTEWPKEPGLFLVAGFQPVVLSQQKWRFSNPQFLSSEPHTIVTNENQNCAKKAEIYCSYLVNSSISITTNYHNIRYNISYYNFKKSCHNNYNKGPITTIIKKIATCGQLPSKHQSRAAKKRHKQCWKNVIIIHMLLAHFKFSTLIETGMFSTESIKRIQRLYTDCTPMASSWVKSSFEESKSESEKVFHVWFYLCGHFHVLCKIVLIVRFAFTNKLQPSMCSLRWPTSITENISEIASKKFINHEFFAF